MAYHTARRHILTEFGVEWRHSKTVLGKSKNPEYDLKRIEELSTEQQNLLNPPDQSHMDVATEKSHR